MNNYEPPGFDVSEMIAEGMTEGFQMAFRMFLDILLNPWVIGFFVLIIGLKFLDSQIKKKRNRPVQSGDSHKTLTDFNFKTDMHYKLLPSVLTAREASLFCRLASAGGGNGASCFC